jgi:oxygen-independent coproporphyrinogen-3 oxidase
MSEPLLQRNYGSQFTYWREYPERDIEFVRWYPCNIGKLGPGTVLDAPHRKLDRFVMYLHIPFCTVVCTSCPYNKLTTRNDLVERYMAALRKEIELYAANPYFAGAELIAGAIGGGTPTALRADQLRDMLGWIRDGFRVAKDFQLTVESTPNDIDERKAEALLEGGCDRISLGVQTFHDPLLRHLGRARTHTRERALSIIHTLRRIGFKNLGIDYMMGIPGQTWEHWVGDTRVLLELPVTSFSIYNYLVLPGSEAHFRIQSGSIPPCPPGELVDEMYTHFVDAVLSNGYVAVTQNDFGGPVGEWVDRGARFFPIPNPEGKPYQGMQSAGLLTQLYHTWYEGGETLAVGAGACGTINDYMYLNEPKLGNYMEAIENGRLPYTWGVYVSERERMHRSLALGMKLLRYRRDDFRRFHGVDLYDVFHDEIDSLLEKGLVTLDDEALQLTYPRGWHYIDNVCKAFYSEANRRLPQPSTVSTELLRWQVA